jgi:hypothetical protein
MAQEKELKLGMKALNMNTPKWAKWIYRVAGLTGSLWVLIISYYPEIPQPIQIGVMKATGLGTAVIYGLCQFAGYAPTDKDNGSTTV